MREMRFISGFDHRQGEIILFPDGMYELLEGVILKRKLNERDVSGEYGAPALYGNGDLLVTCHDKNNIFDYRCISKNVVLQRLDSFDVDIPTLLNQIQKQEELSSVIARRKIQSTSIDRSDIVQSKIYGLFEWIDEYFNDQSFSISHSDIASLAITTRVTATIFINKMYNMGMLENSQIKKKVGVKLLIEKTS